VLHRDIPDYLREIGIQYGSYRKYVVSLNERNSEETGNIDGKQK
jgi:hypothetical protein